MERSCGGCTACCKTHGIFELQKIPGKWCPHCQVGNGCRIYSRRPQSCQVFRCMWLKGLGSPEHRPDKTGIVPEIKMIPGIAMAMIFYEFVEGSLNSEFTRKWTLNNLRVGNCVAHVHLRGNYTIYLSIQ